MSSLLTAPVAEPSVAVASVTPRPFSRLTIVLLAGLVGGMATPCRGQETQALDSTGMPSLELLAQEAGRASRRHAVRAVSPTMLCEADHPLVDSASVAACAVLAGTRAASIVAAFAKGLEVPVVTRLADADTSIDSPTCPPDIEKGVEPRVLLARVTAPVVGVRERVWEGRLTMELRCRSTKAERGKEIATLGKSYLYQWIGREWKLYQFSWWRSERK
jgi:hypothetical protein